MHFETEIRRLDIELSGLEERYGRIMRESMDDNGSIELRDESLRREASDLKQRIIEIKRRRDGLKYSLLSDDEKNKSRQDQIAWATKFSEEGANARRLIYMKHYLELLEKTACLAETAPEKGREYRALYDYLNGQDFRYSLEADFDSFCANDPSLEQSYLTMKNSFQTMTREEALELAAAYQDRYRFSTRVDNLTRAVHYDAFEQMDGPAWAIEAALPPSTFEGTDTITYVVSVRERCVKFIINSSGFIKYPHQKSPGFSDDELQDLKDAGFDVADE